MDVRLTPADGAWERDAAVEMLASAPDTQRIIVGADRGYDAKDLAKECRTLKVTPHVAQKQCSVIDGRTTQHEGYRVSQRAGNRIEEVFGWMKTVAGGRKLRYYGIPRNRLCVEMTIAGYNLVRVSKLTAAA